MHTSPFIPAAAASHTVSNAAVIRELDAEGVERYAATTSAQLARFEAGENNDTTRQLTADLQHCRQQYRQLTGRELPTISTSSTYQPS